MREIKFRGKYVGTGEWVYGDLIHKRHTQDVVMIQDEKGFGCDVWPDTVGQYTGLKDVNGKEVYEGDIVRYRLTDERYTKNPRYKNLFIYYEGSLAKFQAGNIFWDSVRSGKVEVIGNIYDNHSLLDAQL